MSERLQKYLARAGVASRRHAEGLITAGRVSINNQRVTELGTKVEPGDMVTVDGTLVSPPESTAWFVLYKPSGVVTTMEDPQGRPTVAHYIKEAGRRLFPVGRLDYDAEGALLFTDNGELANKLTHPRYGVRRTYLAKVKGDPDKATLDKLLSGVRLEDGMAKPLEAEVFERAEKNTWIKLVVDEGRPHLIKRLCAAVGHPVVRLFRPAQGGISVDGMQPGEFRELAKGEVEKIEKVASGEAMADLIPNLPARRHGHGPALPMGEEEGSPAPRGGGERQAFKGRAGQRSYEPSQDEAGEELESESFESRSGPAGGGEGREGRPGRGFGGDQERSEHGGAKRFARGERAATRGRGGMHSEDEGYGSRGGPGEPRTGGYGDRKERGGFGGRPERKGKFGTPRGGGKSFGGKRAFGGESGGEGSRGGFGGRGEGSRGGFGGSRGPRGEGEGGERGSRGGFGGERGGGERGSRGGGFGARGEGSRGGFGGARGGEERGSRGGFGGTRGPRSGGAAGGFKPRGEGSRGGFGGARGEGARGEGDRGGFGGTRGPRAGGGTGGARGESRGGFGGTRGPRTGAGARGESRGGFGRGEGSRGERGGFGRGEGARGESRGGFGRAEGSRGGGRFGSAGGRPGGSRGGPRSEGGGRGGPRGEGGRGGSGGGFGSRRGPPRGRGPGGGRR